MATLCAIRQLPRASELGRQLRRCTAQAGKAENATPSPGAKQEEAAGGAAEAGGQQTPGRKDIAEVKLAADDVFNVAVNDRYVVLSEEDFEKDGKVAVHLQRKWAVGEAASLHLFNRDTMWKDWERLEQDCTPQEILDLPHFASGLTVYLRWRVVSLRTRTDKFFNISELMEMHMQKRHRTYRNAYQTIRHTSHADRTRWSRFFSVPSKEVIRKNPFPPFVQFVHSRHKRDLLTVYNEDSFTRTARKRNFSKNKLMAEEYWKYDPFYQTKWESRRNGVLEMLRLVYFVVRLPAVFVVWRSALIFAEHTSLLWDYLQVYAKGGRSVDSSEIAHKITATRADGLPMNEGERTIRERIQSSNQSSPASTMLMWTLFFTILSNFYIFLYEGRLPFYLVPYHEREYYLDLLRASTPVASSLGWFERPAPPPVPPQPRPDYTGMSNL